MDNPFYTTRSEIQEAPASGKRVPGWFWPLTVMTFILGSLIAAALKTETVVARTLVPAPSASGPGLDYLTYQNTFSQLQKTIGDLQKRNQILEHGVVSESPETNELAAQLDQYRVLAGITPVTGPGIIVTLRDSTKSVPLGVPQDISTTLYNNYTIHDNDIERVVNELRAAGGEAFSVNDQRVVATTAIRCVGPAIQVNGVPLTPPYVIRTIGDTATLVTALKLRGGVNEGFTNTDPAMITIKTANSMLLPAFEGSVTLTYCKPVKDVGASTASSPSAVASSNTEAVRP
jgi:uncharacterized protein YlxW (UPF0749 family)